MSNTSNTIVHQNGISSIQAGYSQTLPNGEPYIPNDPFRTLISPFEGLAFPSSPAIQLAARKENYTPTTLATTTHVYSSPYMEDLTALGAFFADFECEYEINEFPPRQITVTVPWGTLSNVDFNVSLFASEQWEIVPQQEQKSLIQQGLLINPFAPPTQTGNYVILPAVMQLAVQNAYDNKTTTITPPTGSLSGSYIPFLPYAQMILNYMRGGVEGTPSYTQVLKRTAVIDNRNINNAFKQPGDNQRTALNAQGTINYLYSTSDLANFYAIDSYIQTLLLPSYSKQVSVIGLDPQVYTAYAGWLVQPPTIQRITKNKSSIQQLFAWNEWLSGLYNIQSSINQFPLVVNPSANPNGFIPTT